MQEAGERAALHKFHDDPELLPYQVRGVELDDVVVGIVLHHDDLIKNRTNLYMINFFFFLKKLV